MQLIHKLANVAKDRVNKYGAQYSTFAVFGLVNYPLAFLYELIYNSNNIDGLWFRVISTILCFILLLNDKWPQKLKKFLPLYWYSTILIILPVMVTFNTLIENFSITWLMNFNIGIMIVVLLLDSLAFLVVTGIGIILGTVIFYLSGHSFHSLTLPNFDNLMLFLYMFICIVVLGSIFSRNKEIFNHYIQKTKDDLNEALEQKVQERTIDLQKALYAKTEFLNNMSHEMRTPVSGFTAISEGLVENWNILTEERRIKYTKDIANSAKRLCSLISNLLDLSTFAANKMHMNFVQMDLNKIIEDTINETKLIHPTEKEIHINYTPIKEAFVIADSEWIIQVIRHFFSNAIKFLPHNGIITISINKTKNNWHCIFSDNGIGIPENEIKTIFEPFSQSSLTKTGAGGRGLGLAICKEIIDAHAGKIWATNNKNFQGASFHFTLPIKSN